MVVPAFSGTPHHHHYSGQDLAVGIASGLVPCPLTLFVMTFSMSKGVPVAAVPFAMVMMIGVAVTLSTVSAVTILFRKQIVRLFETRSGMLTTVARGLQALSGAILVALAVHQVGSSI
ncbi:sulfite exporter TauE/SafE family protein [Rhizobium ruizarguesonis]